MQTQNSLPSLKTSGRRGPFVYETVSGARSLKYIITPHGRAVKNGSIWDYEYNLTDHLGNVRVVFKKGSNGLASIVQEKSYYSFGMEISQFSTGTGTSKNWYNGKEIQDDFGLYWYDYGARFYDPALGRFHTVDAYAEKYLNLSPYQYAMNNPIKYIDINGDSTFVYILDQGQRPQDNGTSGTSYTANVYVVDEGGDVNGPFKGSSYPNSVSNTDNSTTANTLSEGTHQFNNKSGHKGGTKQGLNIDDGGTCERTACGTTPDGDDIQMQYVNVHSGTSDKGNAKSRGSTGCQTIAPTDANGFFSIFDWSGKSGNTGNTVGTISVVRNNERSASMTASFEERKTMQQQNMIAPLQPLTPRAVVSVSQ